MAQISWDPDRYQAVNRHPVNQAAMRLLQDTEAQPERTPMYAHQLIRWAAKENPEAYDPALMPRLMTFLDETQLAWTPEKQLQFLLRTPEGADEVEGVEAEDLVVAEDLLQMSPEDAAETLLEILHENLMLTDVTYPHNHSQDLEANLSDPQEMEDLVDLLVRRLQDNSSA